MKVRQFRFVFFHWLIQCFLRRGTIWYSFQVLIFFEKLVFGGSSLSNPFVDVNTSNLLARVRKSAAVFIFFSRVGALSVFFSLLMFLFYHFFCDFFFILDRLTLAHVFSPKIWSSSTYFELCARISIPEFLSNLDIFNNSVHFLLKI